jgi:hypothetical protein
MSLRITFGIALWALFPAGTRAQVIDEYRVKAAFIYNFAKFVEWPQQTFKTPADPIVICLLGQNPFGAALVDAVTGKAVEGRTFQVRQLNADQGAGGCQIVFVGASERKRVRAFLAEIKNGGVLTIGETDDFTSQGGMINFKIEAGRVRLQVSMDAADEARLRISSKLLSLAEIVKR